MDSQVNKIKTEIEGTSSLHKLKELKDSFMSSAEYAVLAKEQGLVTRVTGRKTGAVKALESMFAQQEEYIKQKPQLK